MPAVFEIRRLVFMVEQGVSEAEERDGADDDALHYLAISGDMPAGTARVLIDGDTGKIGRVAVLAMERGQGLGQHIMAFVLDDLQNRGLRKAKLGAQTHALGFYEALGFQAMGPEFMDAGIPHRMMERVL
jgi:ElaA protein